MERSFQPHEKQYTHTHTRIWCPTISRRKVWQVRAQYVIRESG